MDISLHQWPASTRPCRFSLSLQSDSVFADFDIGDDGRVYLCRISFDGFGCYSLDGNIPRLSESESHLLLDSLENASLDSDCIHKILYRYFEVIQNNTWHDALVAHGLIKVIS